MRETTLTESATERATLAVESPQGSGSINSAATAVIPIIPSGQPPGKPGRPTLYTPETIEKLLNALSAGLTHKQACLACGIDQSTLANWRERYPDLEPRMEAAREEARQKALEGIKAAGENDWRALAEWLKLTFPEHRPGHSINVSATANAQQAVVITGEHRKQLQEKLRRYQEYQDSPERAKTKQPANG
jgi:hypothetical protein